MPANVRNGDPILSQTPNPKEHHSTYSAVDGDDSPMWKLSTMVTSAHSFQNVKRETVIRLKRHTYTYDEVEQVYKQLPEGELPPWKCAALEDLVPAVRVAKMYRCNRDFVPDLLSGLTVACLHLPQGLAYGLLAGLTPISGLYTSIVSVSVYIIFGTVPHMSMGTNAVLSLITVAMVEREADKYFQRLNSTTASPATGPVAHDYGSNERMEIKLGVAMTSTMVCGVILLVMGLLRMGFLTNYMPSSFVGGFTSAAALHIAMSQIKHVFHIAVPVRSGFGKLLWTFIDIITKLDDANMVDTLVCSVSAIALIFLDWAMNPLIKAKWGHALPSNLLVVLVGTAVSYVAQLEHHWQVAVVGSVGGGLPWPRLPILEPPVVVGVLYDSLTQAVIVFAMSISMGMLMAKLHDYDLDSNRELVAYGACNLVSSFFPVQSSSVSPPRTMILSNTGARTTFCGVSTALVLLAGVGFLGEAFAPLPVATLAAMIIVAVLDVLLQVRHVPAIWRISRTDWLVWMATWLATAFGDLEYGICTGVLMAALTFMVNNQYIKGELVVCSESEDLLVPGLGRAGTQHIDKTRVFYFPSQLFFANAESFKKQLFHHVFNPTQVPSSSISAGNENSTSGSVSSSECPIKHIILDCSAMTYVDIDGLNMLKSIVIKYHNAGVQVMLARCPHTTMEMLERGDFFSLVPRSLVFHEVVDALARSTGFEGLGVHRSSHWSTNVKRMSTVNLVSTNSFSLL